MPPPQQMTDGNERNLVKTKTQWRKTLVTQNQDSCECWYLVDLSFPLSDHIFEMLPEGFYIEIGAQSDFAIFAFKSPSLKLTNRKSGKCTIFRYTNSWENQGTEYWAVV